ncbi:MAG: alpha/beta hydrolase, partial [Actinobacteria bacterium]|nr:alpha/beta hydrolase [Actinomycetota bacterium]
WECVLRILKNSLRIEKTFILGHSWGSMLAAEYAIKYPHEIKALILSGTFLSVPLWIRDTNRLKKGLSKNTQEVIHKNEKAGTLNSKEYQKATLEFYKKHLCRIYPYPKPFQEEQDNAGMDVYLTMWGPTEFNCTGNLKSYDLTSQLHKIKVPVLLLCGRYDEARPETVRYYKSLFPNAVMKVFEKSSHMSYLEERDNYIKTVEEFLKKVE